MKQHITIPVDVPSDIFLALNTSEKDLKHHFQTLLAAKLYEEGKLTLGKACQMSGLSRFAFEKALAKLGIPTSLMAEEQVLKDLDNLKDV